MSGTNNELTIAQKQMTAAIQRANESEAGLGEIVIKYRPYASLEKWVEYRFSAWSTAKAWFAMALVVAFFGFGGPNTIAELIKHAIEGGAIGATTLGTGTDVAAAAFAASNQWPYAFLAGLFGALAITTLGAYTIYPTDIRINQRGVHLEWNRFKRRFRKSLSWDGMERVELFYPTGKTAQSDCVMRFKSRLDKTPVGIVPSALGMFMRSLIPMPKDEESICVKFGAVATIDERDKLHRAIDRWAGDIGRDVQLIEMLKPAQDHSYTELWMQALSAPPKRERLTPLPNGAPLQSGRFIALEQLGVGGQGTAYLSRETESGTIVVLKEFILPVYVDVNVRRQALERMQNEAAMLRRLDNPRVVRLIDFFIEDHRGYLVLECIDGFSLRKIIDEQGCMQEPQVRDLALQMCAMLKYLHNLTPPVVHRDFTPDNLILGSDGILKIVDFNVAQQTESTATGTVVGKQAYLPPEQFRGRPVAQSDIYAMGATLYFMLLGHDPEAITCSHPILKDENVSEGMDNLIAKATALDLAKRYQKIEDLEADLAPKAEAVT